MSVQSPHDSNYICPYCNYKRLYTGLCNCEASHLQDLIHQQSTTIRLHEPSSHHFTPNITKLALNPFELNCFTERTTQDNHNPFHSTSLADIVRARVDSGDEPKLTPNNGKWFDLNEYSRNTQRYIISALSFVGLCTLVLLKRYGKSGIHAIITTVSSIAASEFFWPFGSVGLKSGNDGDYIQPEIVDVSASNTSITDV